MWPFTKKTLGNRIYYGRFSILLRTSFHFTTDDFPLYYGRHFLYYGPVGGFTTDETPPSIISPGRYLGQPVMSLSMPWVDCRTLAGAGGTLSGWRRGSQAPWQRGQQGIHRSVRTRVIQILSRGGGDILILTVIHSCSLKYLYLEFLYFMINFSLN